MFEPKGLKKIAAFAICRMSAGYKPEEDSVINHSEILRSPRAVLVCMPFIFDEFQAAVPILDMLAARFSRSELSIITMRYFRNWLPRQFLPQMILLTAENANFIKLPRKRLRAMLKAKRFDVAIDLNLRVKLFSSILCAVCGAKVRVGFAGEKSDNYFNFQVQTRPDSDINGKYHALMGYLN